MFKRCMGLLIACSMLFTVTACSKSASTEVAMTDATIGTETMGANDIVANPQAQDGTGAVEDMVYVNRGPAVGKGQIEQWGGTPNSDSTLVRGKLHVDGQRLVDASGNPMQLRGVSTHGVQWFPQYVSEDSFRTLRDTWHANVVRLAVYSAEGGYVDGDRAGILQTIDRGVQAASALSMYVIIDWHILSDSNPNQHVNEAKEFFNIVSEKYKDNTNVLYEICNEPNGGTTMQDIKNYADVIIPVIHSHSSDAVILVGTPTWSQDLDKVRDVQLNDSKNVMYTLHFYAATHKDDLRNKLIAAEQSGIPVFISEFSICDSSGNGGIDTASADAWKKLINEYGISYCSWSLCNKAETSALIKSDCSKLSGWEDADLSDTGLYIKNMMLGR